MNQWFIQDAFMITNGIVVAAFIAGAAFLLLFWKYMALLGDYDALMKQEQKRVENDYLKWVYYEKPMQIQRREKETRPSEVSEDSAREA
jgi:hypothetical protein